MHIDIERFKGRDVRFIYSDFRSLCMSWAALRSPRLEPEPWPLMRPKKRGLRRFRDLLLSLLCDLDRRRSDASKLDSSPFQSFSILFKFQFTFSQPQALFREFLRSKRWRTAPKSWSEASFRRLPSGVRTLESTSGSRLALGVHRTWRFHLLSCKPLGRERYRIFHIESCSQSFSPLSALATASNLNLYMGEQLSSCFPRCPIEI